MSARYVRKCIVRATIAVLLFYTSVASVNPASRLALIDSLLSRGTPATEDSPFFNRLDMVFEDGHFYSDKPPLLALYSSAVIAPAYGPLTFDRGPAGKILYWLVVASASGLALLILVLATRSLHNMSGGRVPGPWLTAGAIAGTCVLPFARTYNDHIMEAATLLVAFALLRNGSKSTSFRRPLGVGVLIGLAWLLHPLVGSVTAVTTGFYYLARRAGAGFGRQVLLAAVFSVGTLGTIALGTAAHVALYDRAVPFYFSPELYLWTDGPGGVESHWLTEPTVPGLTADRITARFQELGLSEDRLEDTLSRFEAHSKSVRNPLRFMLQRLFRYGQLTFNPLVMFCLLLATASLRRKPYKYRAETIWALISVVFLVVASIALRAVPGGSFGDRHLLPAAPLLVVAGGLATITARDAALFRALALISVSIMIPGALAPWVTPGDSFLGVNLVVTCLALLGAVLVWQSEEDSAIGLTWSRLEAALTYRKVFVLVTVAGLLQVLLYLGTLPKA